VFDDQLEASVIELKTAIDAAQTQLALRVAEFDARQIATQHHALSTRSWLRHHCRMTARDASALLTRGKALLGMPDVTCRALRGEITSQGVTLLTFARNRHPKAFEHHEGVFADVATWLGTNDLRKAINHWEQQVDHDGAVSRVESQRRLRRLSHHQTFEGMWAGSWDLDAESGHVLDTAIRSHSDAANLDPAEHRTVPQRRADSMVDICRFWLDHNTTIGTSGGEKPHVTVTVDYEILRRTSGVLPAISDGQLTAERIRQLACDAGIVRMIVDADSVPLDVGRSTTGTVAAPGPDATPPWDGAMPITSFIGPMEETRASPT
jgi:hypothetical protein